MQRTVGRWSRRWRYVVFVLIFAGQAAGEPAPLLSLTAAQQYYPLGTTLEYVEDPTGRMTITDVTQPEYQRQFLQSQEDVPNFGFTTSAFWVRFRVRNETSKTPLWLLDVGNPFIDHVDCYLLQPDGQWEQRQSGDSIPFWQREFAYPNVVFHLRVAQDAEQTVYMRFQNKGRIALHLTLWEAEAFTLHHFQRQFGAGLLYGAVVIMIVYNLLLFVVLKDSMHIHYSVFALAVGLMLLTNEGLAYQYLWPRAVWWNDVSLNLLVGLSGSLALSFGNHFLRLKAYSRWLYWSAIGIIMFWIALTIGFLLTRHPIFPQLIISLNLPSTIILIGAGFLAWQKGYQPARYYLLSWGVFFSGVFLEVLGMMGLIPIVFVEDQGIRIGFVLALALLSLAMADRIQQLKQDKADAQADALRIAQEHEQLVQQQNLLLEQTVAARLKDLRQSHQELEQKNAQLQHVIASKDKFFAIIAQDLQTPLTGLLELTEFVPEHVGEFSPAELQEVAGKLRSSLENLYELLKNLFTWSGMQRGTLLPQPQEVDLHAVIRRNLNLFIPAAEHKHIILRSSVQEQTLVYADQEMVYAILRNLISNAIKFSFPGDKVSITTNSHDDTVEIAVADTGVGISPANQAKLFIEDATFQTPGTDGEEGTGLGLMLCKVLVEKNNGHLWVESEEGAGSTFHVIFPRRPASGHSDSGQGQTSGRNTLI